MSFLRRQESPKSEHYCLQFFYMEPTKSDVDKYINNLPLEFKAALTKFRELVRSVVPEDSIETFSYGVPSFRYNGKAIVAYAASKGHCAYYPMNPALIMKFKDELKDFSTDKGTIRFTPDEPLPVSLVKRMVKARLEEIL